MSDPTDQDLPDEQQLDEYLQGGSSVSQQYGRLRSAEVPAELDRLVLRQAHDAVKPTRPEKSRTWMRWTAPLALAASAVLVVSIVIESGVHDGEMLMSAPAPASAPMEAKRRSEAADRDASGNIAAEAPGAAPVGPSRAFVPPREIAEPDAAASSTYAAPPPADAESQPPRKAGTLPQDEMRRERRVAPAPQAAANSSPSLSTEQALARQGMTSAAIQQSAEVLPGAAAPAPESAADVVAEEEKSPALQQYSDPELWLRDIRQLRRENRKELADKEWRRFRAAFPNYVVEEGDTAREAR